MFFPRSFKPIAAVGSKEEMSHESVTLSDVHTFHAPLNKRPRWSMNAELYWTEGVWSSWSHALNGYFHPLKTSLELHFMTLAAFVRYTWTTSSDHPPSSADRTCNLGRNKIEQQPPPPPPTQSRMKQRNSQNAQISHHWLGGGREGGKNFSSILSKAVGLRAMHELNIVLWAAVMLCCPHQPHGAIASNTRTHSSPRLRNHGILEG